MSWSVGRFETCGGSLPRKNKCKKHKAGRGGKNLLFKLANYTCVIIHVHVCNTIVGQSNSIVSKNIHTWTALGHLTSTKTDYAAISIIILNEVLIRHH